MRTFPVLADVICIALGAALVASPVAAGVGWARGTRRWREWRRTCATSPRRSCRTSAATRSPFTPESYNYACDERGDCTQVTQGTLAPGGSPTAYTWPHAVPQHHPFPVQLTFIRWQTAPRIYNDGDARTNLTFGLILVVLGSLMSLLFGGACCG